MRVDLLQGGRLHVTGMHDPDEPPWAAADADRPAKWDISLLLLRVVHFPSKPLDLGVLVRQQVNKAEIFSVLWCDGTSSRADESGFLVEMPDPLRTGTPKAQHVSKVPEHCRRVYEWATAAAVGD